MNITEEQIHEIIKALANKKSCFYSMRDAYVNSRENPFYSEAYGMEQTLQMLGVEYEYEFDNDYECTAIICGEFREEIETFKK